MLMWRSPCFHRQTSSAIPDNPFPVWLLWSKQEQWRVTTANAIIFCKNETLAMPFHLLKLHSCCCNVPFDPQQAKRGLICTRRDQDTCLSLRHPLSLLWWLDHQVEENGGASRQAGWEPEAQFWRIYLSSYLSARQHSLTSLTARSWHFVFFQFLPNAYVLTAVYS